MAEEKQVARVHMSVRGRVQNVGFRAHVEYSARQLDLRGWVRNVGADTVETVAEGDRLKLERFVESVKAGPRGSQVEESNVDWSDPTGEFTNFTVRRSL